MKFARHLLDQSLNKKFMEIRCSVPERNKLGNVRMADNHGAFARIWPLTSANETSKVRVV